MMRKLRRVNVDHLHVGWYQSADVGNFISLALLESQYHYQNSIEESVVLIYGKYTGLSLYQSKTYNTAAIQNTYYNWFSICRIQIVL
jgi:hypothetical protein